MTADTVPEPLRAVARRAFEAGVFLDFDGCLAPIVPDPRDARAIRGAASALQRLARRVAVVAVISGRSAADLAARVRAPGVRLLGLHGLEERRDARTVIDPEAATAAGAIERAAAELERAVGGLRGVWVERKGLMLAVHFRNAPDPAAAQRLVSPAASAAAEAGGLEVMPGRRILELRPRAGGDKGDALRRVAAAAGVRAAAVFGDDVGDVPAFRAARDLPVHACVAVDSAESPPELLSLADVVLGSPAEAVAALRGLADAVPGGGG